VHELFDSASLSWNGLANRAIFIAPESRSSLDDRHTEERLSSSTVEHRMLLSGKKGLIVGVANKHSIAWAIAQSAAGQGAQLFFNYQNERLKENVEELVATLPGSKAFPCDAGDDAQIDSLMNHVGKEAGKLDFLIHSIAFAPREELTGQFVNTTRKGFATALDVSAYSLVALTRAALPLMTEGGSVVTLTYLGAERVVPHYNVMGVAKAALEATVRYLAHDLGPRNIRVNAISAGPVRTLAARSIAGFPTMEAIVEERAPLHRHIDADDVGAAAAYLLSDDARNVTATTLYVDSGYHSMGM
jgi:enoyl-[acyl-carrier protein] reductase I